MKQPDAPYDQRTRNALALLDAREEQLKEQYVNGWYERDEYVQRLAEIHAHISRVTEAGPCVCRACREHRAATTTTTQED